jgi:hypothetical protein
VKAGYTAVRRSPDVPIPLDSRPEPIESFAVVPRGAPAPPGVSRLTVLLIKPSKYDDDGYIMRFLRGVLPSNTLSTLAALTE